ncbi:DUF268 domain-containing protein [Candidatus Aalborgicola defluviihabitans]|uniref:DUF268 domain-containing protein n=1 Tax=Candidatus Aalborgicola defluviihabitans TaxID=3386187 RepID=UPI0039B90E59
MGRYGDPIDPLGYQKGLSNMIAFLKQGGTFYLSIPIGQERVEFNAFRVFDPFEIIQLTKAQGLICNLLTVISPKCCSRAWSDFAGETEDTFKF